MSRFRFPISNLKYLSGNRGSIARLIAACAAICAVVFLASETFARVGGGQSYGGGGGSGSGGGGGGGALVYLIVRLLLWLTIEHPVIGIPVDIIVIGLVIYRFTRPARQSVSLATSPMVSAPDTVAGAIQHDLKRVFNQLRRF